MQIKRDELFKVVQRIRKNIVQGQVDAWYGMLCLSVGSRVAQLEICASVNGLDYREWIPGVKISPNFRATIGCEALYQALKSKWEDREIELNLAGNHLCINLVGSTKKSDMVYLPCRLIDPPPTTGKTATVKAEIFHNLLSQVAHARSNDQTREHLRGVELVCELTREEASTSRVLRATATDGHRLATADVLFPYGPAFNVVLSSDTVKTLLPALRRSPKDADVQLSIGEHAIVFETSEFSLSALLVDCQFPPWRQVCPRENEGARMHFKWGLETVALRNAIEQSVRATTTDPGGTFIFDEQWLTIQVVDGEDPQKSLSTVRVESALASPHIVSRAKFNLAYWQEAMASIPKGSDIEIQFGSYELDAIAIHAGNAMHVIMPMRQ